MNVNERQRDLLVTGRILSVYHIMKNRKGWFNVTSPSFHLNGGAEGVRTPCLFLAKEALSQMSYSPETFSIIPAKSP